MTLQEALDYTNSLRANPDSPSGDDEELMKDLIYLSTMEIKTMLNFPFDLERKRITASGGSTEDMDSDFDGVVGSVEVGSTQYPMMGIEQINHLSTGSSYVYMTFDKVNGLWKMNFNPSLTAGDTITFTQKTSDSRVNDTSNNLPLPKDVCMYIVYDVAARLEWQDDEGTKGEELKQRRELILKDLKKKYNGFSNKNQGYAQFDEQLGGGFGSIGTSSSGRQVSELS